MSLAALQASVLQTNGALSVAAGAQITVRTPAGALATLYTDRAGTTPTGANPIFADSKGYFRVYVEPGRYDVTVTTSSGAQAYKDIALFADGFSPGDAATANIGTATGEVIGTDEAREYFGLEYEPSVLPTISSDFERNKHELYEQYGNEPKTILQTWTTTRATTGTYRDAAGVIRTAGPHEPRIDYDPVTGRGALLVEEARTRLNTYPADLTNAAWSKTGVTNLTAQSFDTTAGTQVIIGSSSVGRAANAVMTAQWLFGKNNSTGVVTISIDDGATVNRGRAGFDPATGSVSAIANDGDFSNTSAVVKDWGYAWHVSLTTTTGAGTLARMRFFSTAGTTLTGTSKLYFQQIEVGATSSSIILDSPESQVTRSADNVSRVLGNEFKGVDAFTLFADFKNTTFANGIPIFDFYTNGDNRIQIRTNGFGTAQNLVRIGGVTQDAIDVAGVYAQGGRHKLCVVVHKDKWLFVVDGITRYERNFASPVVSFDGLNGFFVRSPHAGAKIQATYNTKIYPRALTEAECIALTTL